mmetsp:Transcript_6236/g.9648  ORF Transcript_6236/g.9648 Transcript_6236/m.9648 type:complete len:243 (+) Transcript_6236:889-1617(+)
MRKSRLHWIASPCVLFYDLSAHNLGGVLGVFQEALGRVCPPIEAAVLKPPQQVLVDIVVYRNITGVDNTKVHTGLDGVVQEHRVEGLTNGLVATEGEGHVGNTTRDMAPRQGGTEDAGGFNEVDDIFVVLLNTRGHCQNVGIEDDVVGVELHLVYQNTVGTCANLHLALDICRLTLLIKRHNHHSSPMPFDNFGIFNEGLLALLQGNTVYDAFPLRAFEALFDYRELRRVDHKGQLADFGLR